MSTFHLPNHSPPLPIHLPPTLSEDKLLSFIPFQNWLSTLTHSLSLQRQRSHPFHASPYSLRTIDVQAVDYFGGDRVGFVKLRAEVTNERGEKLPGSVFLRGGSVGMMLILQPDDLAPDTEAEKQVILTLQPRIPAGSLSLPELPAGMLDDSGTFSGGAAKEIAEETGLEIPAGDLVNLTELALGSTREEGEEGEEGEEREDLERGVYMSPGGCDEFVPLFLWQKRVSREQMRGWEGKLSGLRGEGEKITLVLCPLERLWRVGARDGKILAAWALYEGLRREGRI